MEISKTPLPALPAGAGNPLLGMAPWLVALTQLYLLALFGWALLYFLFNDRWWWLFLINSGAHYLFFPLPLLLLLAWLRPHRPFVVSLGLAAGLALYLYGATWLPQPLSVLAGGDGPTLKVMTYNMLGYNQEPERVLAAIRASNADVIALQELNTITATAFQQELMSEYPYQLLAPHDGVRGIGLLSRYPFHVQEAELPGVWVAPPQTVLLEFGETPVTVLNFHAIPPLSNAIEDRDMEWSIGERERQARTMAAFAAAQPGPVLVLGDLNTGHLSRAHALLTETLVDAWQEGSWGLGHTFPGAASPGSSRPKIGTFYVPKWLVRIDYIFHSPHWQTLSAEIGPWDEVSDHRPVVATLRLK